MRLISLSATDAQQRAALADQAALIGTGPRARAGRGARYLDRYYPGWASRIDLDTLSTVSANRCVLAQATPHGGYYESWVAAREAKRPEVMGPDGEPNYGLWSVEHGFSGSTGTDAWLPEILSRRTPAKAPAGEGLTYAARVARARERARLRFMLVCVAILVAGAVLLVLAGCGLTGTAYTVDDKRQLTVPTGGTCWFLEIDTVDSELPMCVTQAEWDRNKIGEYWVDAAGTRRR